MGVGNGPHIQHVKPLGADPGIDTRENTFFRLVSSLEGKMSCLVGWIKLFALKHEPYNLQKSQGLLYPSAGLSLGTLDSRPIR